MMTKNLNLPNPVSKNYGTYIKVAEPGVPGKNVIATLRLAGVLAAIGVSRSTLYHHINQGLWPKPFRIGARAVGWPAEEVRAIRKARIAGETDAEIRQLVVHLVSLRHAYGR